MDFITTGVIASAVYDVLKRGAQLSGDILKNRLGSWIKDKVVADALATELAKLNIRRSNAGGSQEKVLSV